MHNCLNIQTAVLAFSNQLYGFEKKYVNTNFDLCILQDKRLHTKIYCVFEKTLQTIKTVRFAQKP